jgi:hypothetical protein
MEPHGQTRSPSVFSAESAEAKPPAHKASESYPFGIDPRGSKWSSAKADKAPQTVFGFHLGKFKL